MENKIIEPLDLDKNFYSEQIKGIKHMLGNSLKKLPSELEIYLKYLELAKFNPPIRAVAGTQIYFISDDYQNSPIVTNCR